MRISLVIWMILISIPSFGQRLGLSTGFTMVRLQDELHSPFIFRGALLPIGIDYTIEKPSWLLYNALHTSGGILKNSTTSSTFHVRNVFFQSFYVRRILSKPFVLSAGVAVEAHVFAREMGMSRANENRSVGEFFFDLTPTIVMRQEIKRLKFNVMLQATPFAYLIARDYNTFFFEKMFDQGDWVSGGEFQNVQLRAEVMRPISNRWNIGLRYIFLHWSYGQNITTRWQSHQITILLNRTS